MSTAVKQLNGRVERRGTQVHVALGHLELAMTGEFLNRPRRRATHRQVRTERVAEDVNPVAHVCPPGRPLDEAMQQWSGGDYDPDAFTPEAVKFDDPGRRWKKAFGR